MFHEPNKVISSKVSFQIKTNYNIAFTLFVFELKNCTVNCAINCFV